MNRIQAVVLLLVCWVSSVVAQTLPRLPALALNPGSLTVSGLSSGGYMAGQFAVAYSASVSGVAVLAGGPYGCSRGSVGTAMLTCSCPAEKPWLLTVAGAMGGGCQVFHADVYTVFSDAAASGNAGDIDDVSNLQRQRVWLFSGGKDPVVAPPLVQAVKDFYLRRGTPESNIHHAQVADAGHGFPSPLAQQACSATQTPFLTQCQLDAAGDLLKWFYPSLSSPSPGTVNPGSFKRFSQRRYVSRTAFTGPDSTGWLYVPAACEAAGSNCALHVALHGCEQGQSFKTQGQPFGRQFVEGAGYNRWAEAGRIVVLYPQIKASTRGQFLSPEGYNPKGCWDFWGYTEKFAALNPLAPHFATRSAPQMKAIKAMVDDLMRRP